MNSKKLAEFLEYAASLCETREVRLTPQRLEVLSIIAASGKPVGAYEILQKLQQERPNAAPPTAYRALDFLQEQGLVHRLASLQAYLACNHPHDEHQGQFLICSDCGRVREMEDGAIHTSLCKAADKAGFDMDDEIVEILGRCGECKRVRS
ncbi:hypothetical protein BOV90_10755 [Solemya velum gill symbiont]|uniref:Ferric uptake regulation protein n=1 Tax=Solemya velum gill symbiont TaxID=2340 RepID=A0A1T2CPP3_SOVGS|nr:transcriptional repressor [Solemya velum gill symbiont]OOY34131.1 hypothetical protein BOV88_11550 [Solemya velum gill symbiont]OOY36829.1 hypothetical protein BOV89_10460 [Solemya velum gill symbiont]OOY39172.1 hypothetical protein BOV90_10755 [Solemya velum gill symbiont]OOY41339.1 hypothetical protein BOV91_11990 [Solemya velum gill symbiont]OOY44785.1 hypothetical protein BOV92_07930 [Solemya velum gill symbiont]